MVTKLKMVSPIQKDRSKEMNEETENKIEKAEEEVVLPNEVAAPEFDELTQLKARADLMGLSYHHRTGIKKLRLLVKNGQEGKPQKKEKTETSVATPIIAAIPNTKKAVETRGQYKTRKYREAAKLVRVIVSCMNPNKREWEGEIYTVSNSLVGTFKKFIPFNNEEGWHIPQIMYNVLRDKECQIFITKKNERGNRIREGKMIKEFSITVLPDLTELELKALAQQQAMRAGEAT